MLVSRAYPAGPSRQSSYRSLTARTWSWCRPPGMRKGEFWLSMDSIWFCKVLFLFRSNLQVIRAASSTIAPSSQSPRNTPDQSAQVSYSAYSAYLVYIGTCYSYNIIFAYNIWHSNIFSGRIDWQGQLKDDLWPQAEKSSVLCSSHQAHLGKAPLGSCWGTREPYLRGCTPEISLEISQNI